MRRAITAIVSGAMLAAATVGGANLSANAHDERPDVAQGPWWTKCRRVGQQLRIVACQWNRNRNRVLLRRYWVYRGKGVAWAGSW